METTFIYQNGTRVEAVVLAADSRQMRLVRPDGDDAISLTLANGQWTDEAGEPVEFEYFLATGAPEDNRVFATHMMQPALRAHG